MNREQPRLHRVFIAVELDHQLREKVVHIQQALKESGAHMRWVQPQNLHFTLRFLGELPLAEVAKAKIAVREAGRRASPFAIHLKGVGAFPSLERPQVVWIGVGEGEAELARLAEAVSLSLARYHFPKEDRPFTAHLTLGRLKTSRNWGDLVRLLRSLKDVDVGDQRVEAMVVMESRLTPSGPIYTPLETVLLGENGA
ncbi:MAG: RNA 2',3'-cyclic phosphodiesterase [Armatimonadota bacterium]|nr:RNA 2',3'-cyclic phosphodiesterase [Armatimonadota bacterium]